ncbi:hypothetical protein B0H12DRAFT_1232782 [Mycena haematopus]|nr:hypothetical protein B0H12DRAFT_1240319 [Mycena haematopus]KAJ7256882.1 hypothetical protein B0H12DRAFT_1232782 [Mycena haematopus]
MSESEQYIFSGPQLDSILKALEDQGAEVPAILAKIRTQRRGAAARPGVATRLGASAARSGMELSASLTPTLLPRRGASVPLSGNYGCQKFASSHPPLSQISTDLPLPLAPPASAEPWESRQINCRLPPLRIPTNPLASPGPPSPLTPIPLSPCPCDVSLGKRKAAELVEDTDAGSEKDSGEDDDEDDDEDDEDDEDDTVVKRATKRKLPALQSAAKSSNCPRKGDRRLSERHSVHGIGQMPCQQDCDHCARAEGSNAVWTENPSGAPPMTEMAAFLLSKLLGVFGPAGRKSLDELISSSPLLPSARNSPEAFDPTDTQALLKKIGDHSKALKLTELDYMLSLIQLALNVDSEQATARLQHLRVPSQTELAKKYTNQETARSTFGVWLNWGHRLLMLCAAGTLYMLPIIAALDLRTVVTRRCLDKDILAVATAIREVTENGCLK